MGLEEQLCLLLAHSLSSPETEEATRLLLSAAINWERTIALVRAHEILPLVYCHLKQLDFLGVPDAVRIEWADLFRRNALRNELLKAELISVLRQLAVAQVPAIPLKGIPIAESLYGDAALRVCADIDILVPPQDFESAFQALTKSGYHAAFREPQFIRLTAQYGKDCGLMRQDGAQFYPLQLHAGLIWGGPTERSMSNEIWTEVRPTTFHGAPAFAFSPEWEFLYLAAHAARHGLFPLKWLMDIDRLCRRESLDWERVKHKAVRLGWEKIVDSVLSACANLLETPLPSPTCVGDTKQKAKVSAALPDDPDSPLQILNETLFSMRLFRSPSDKLRFLAARVFIPTPRDCQLVSLPSSLFFLYYVLRPMRVSCLVGGWLVRAGIKLVSA